SAQRRGRFRESELRLYGDLGLGFFAMAERGQTGSLRLSEDKLCSLGLFDLGHAAALRLIRLVAVCAVEFSCVEVAGAFPQLRLPILWSQRRESSPPAAPLGLPGRPSRAMTRLVDPIKAKSAPKPIQASHSILFSP